LADILVNKVPPMCTINGIVYKVKSGASEVSGKLKRCIAPEVSGKFTGCTGSVWEVSAMHRKRPESQSGAPAGSVWKVKAVHRKCLESQLVVKTLNLDI
jgi:hypothetical protein